MVRPTECVERAALHTGSGFLRLLTFLLCSGACYAACVPNANLMAAGRAAYYASSEGNQRDTSEASKAFDSLHEQCPRDPETLVYWGSLKLLEASHTWALWHKYSLSKEGIQAMDQAVAAAPDNLEVRFVRAVTTYGLPAFFHRRDQSRNDFAYLARHAQEGRLDPKLAAASVYYYAEFLKAEGHPADAVENWKRAIGIAPHSRAARDSASELKKFG